MALSETVTLPRSDVIDLLKVARYAIDYTMGLSAAAPLRVEEAERLIIRTEAKL